MNSNIVKKGYTFYWTEDATIPIEILNVENDIVQMMELSNFKELEPVTVEYFINRLHNYGGRRILREHASDYVKNIRFNLTKEQIAKRNTDPNNARKRREELIRYMNYEQNFISK